MSASGNFRFIDHADPTTENESFLDAKLGFEKYLSEGFLVIDGYSKVITSTRKTFGEQFVNKLGTSLNPSLPYLSALRADLKAGMRNSRMDEEYDEDQNYDYRFSEVGLSSEHPVVENLNARLNYLSSSRTYVSGNYDNFGFTTGISLRYKPVEHVYIRSDCSYRERNYTLVTSLSHYKDLFSIALGYRIRRDWGIQVEISDAMYRFPNSPSKDRIEYSFSLSVDEYISEDFRLSVDGTYKMRDLVAGGSTNLSSIKISAKVIL